MIEIKLSKKGKHKNKYIAIIDEIDSDLSKLNWFVNLNKKSLTQYASRWFLNKNVFMHLIIAERFLGKKNNLFEVDHINRNGLEAERKYL